MKNRKSENSAQLDRHTYFNNIGNQCESSIIASKYPPTKWHSPLNNKMKLNNMLNKKTEIVMQTKPIFDIVSDDSSDYQLNFDFENDSFESTTTKPNAHPMRQNKICKKKKLISADNDDFDNFSNLFHFFCIFICTRTYSYRIELTNIKYVIQKLIIIEFDF